ncbi:Predicted DNA-binding transcriptional regulator YafY, contains an HTH and WYL domains [Paenibacillaceae bacterium GAS479]|nr:Predicted DNA-binding transcriptional regulator YafY, contains an HTH and WYL domains [Paenibacillaceae bacterium GAS479]
MKGERLLELLLLLQAEGKLNSKELARRLEVSERTIHRDMDALSAAGVPVLSERGNSGGWRLMDGYRTRLTGLNVDEWKALFLASQSRAAHDLGWSSTLDSALLKLRAAHPHAALPHAEGLQSRLLMDGADWHSAQQEHPYLSLLMEAVLQDRMLRFRYGSRDIASGSETGKTAEWRLTEPLALVLKGSSWYLIADERTDAVKNHIEQDESAEENVYHQERVRATAVQRKTFRISRILEAELDDRCFKRPDDFELAAWWADSLERFRMTLPQPFQSRLLLAPDALERLRRMRYVRIAEATIRPWAADFARDAGESATAAGNYQADEQSVSAADRRQPGEHSTAAAVGSRQPDEQSVTAADRRQPGEHSTAAAVGSRQPDEQSVTAADRRHPSEHSTATVVSSKQPRVAGTGLGRCPDASWLQAEVEFDTADYAAGLILSLAPGAIALEPQELRQRVRELALEAALQHAP